MFDPRIERHLIADQGEEVVDEVRKHWAALFGSMLELTGGAIVFLLAAFVPVQAWWVPAALGAAIMLHAGWRIAERRMDRFVITNMRVFRVHGILSQRIATMPLSRILDISVHKPVIGRIFGYGHFVFESAAQEQGLREIRFVGSPDARGLTIQRVIQQAGLRGFMSGQPMATRVERLADPDPEPVAAVPPVPPLPPMPPGGWDWLADAHRREEEHLDDLRRGRANPPFDPDRTTTAPIDLPR